MQRDQAGEDLHVSLLAAAQLAEAQLLYIQSSRLAAAEQGREQSRMQEQEDATRRRELELEEERRQAASRREEERTRAEKELEAERARMQAECDEVRKTLQANNAQERAKLVADIDQMKVDSDAQKQSMEEKLVEVEVELAGAATAFLRDREQMQAMMLRQKDESREQALEMAARLRGRVASVVGSRVQRRSRFEELQLAFFTFSRVVHARTTCASGATEILQTILYKEIVQCFRQWAREVERQRLDAAHTLRARAYDRRRLFRLAHGLFKGMAERTVRYRRLYCAAKKLICWHRCLCELLVRARVRAAASRTCCHPSCHPAPLSYHPFQSAYASCIEPSGPCRAWSKRTGGRQQQRVLSLAGMPAGSNDTLCASGGRSIRAAPRHEGTLVSSGCCMACALLDTRSQVREAAARARTAAPRTCSHLCSYFFLLNDTTTRGDGSLAWLLQKQADPRSYRRQNRGASGRAANGRGCFFQLYSRPFPRGHALSSRSPRSLLRLHLSHASMFAQGFGMLHYSVQELKLRRGLL